MFRTHEVSPLKYLDGVITTLLLTFTGGHLAIHSAVNSHYFMSNIDKVVSADYMGPQKIVFAIDWAKTRFYCCSNQNLSSTGVQWGVTTLEFI